MRVFLFLQVNFQQKINNHVGSMKFILILLVLSFSFTSKEIFAFTEEEKAEKLSLIKQIKSRGETVFAIIPKSVSGPFFISAAKGCADAAKKIGVHCIHFGSSETNMRIQVEDVLSLISTGVDGIAISGIKKGWIANRIGEKLKDWGKPIVAFDSPISSEVAQVYIGTDNYLLGKALGVEIRKIKPNGGSYCIQTERPDSPNHSGRIKGIMDGMTDNGKDKENWPNVFGCPLEHYGDYERAAKQMVRTIGKFNVDIFISTGGGSQFLPALYRKSIKPFKDDIETGKLIFANVDTLPTQLEYLKEGISTINVGQRPYEMGEWSVKVLNMLIEGEVVPSVINTGLTYCTQRTVGTCTN